MNNSSSPSPSASTTILPTAKARPRAAPAVGKALGEGPGQDASHDALHRRLDAAEGRDQDQATHLDKTLEIWGKMVKWYMITIYIVYIYIHSNKYLRRHIHIYIYIYIHTYVYCLCQCLFFLEVIDLKSSCWKLVEMAVCQALGGHTLRTPKLPAPKCCQGCRVLSSQEYLTATASQTVLFHGYLTPPDDSVEYWWILYMDVDG